VTRLSQEPQRRASRSAYTNDCNLHFETHAYRQGDPYMLCLEAPCVIRSVFFEVPAKIRYSWLYHTRRFTAGIICPPTYDYR